MTFVSYVAGGACGIGGIYSSAVPRRRYIAACFIGASNIWPSLALHDK